MGKYRIKAVESSEVDDLYTIKRNSIKPYVSDIWGWNEEFQREDFNEALEEHDVSGIWMDNEIVGMIETWEDEVTINIVEIHLLEKAQGLGIASAFIRGLMKRADDSDKVIHIGCFKDNLKAKSYYEYLGFYLRNTSPFHFEFIYIPKHLLTLTSCKKKEKRKQCYELVVKASKAVSDTLGLTEENCPSFTAFMTWSTFSSKATKNTELYYLAYQDVIVACGAIESTKESHAKLKLIATLPSWQHKGLGHRMLETLEAFAKKKAYSGVKLGAISENELLIEWYETHGYKRVGSKELAHGEFHVALMKKEW